ncbi:unnamed protein product [Vitrella brassicaformis CCMP3155]|uniref:F-box domain-containing protein n=2 Tax=Vitrella brassicaformis TaxID=1169539 RepID=A0A0G4FQ20_VITBC|nr:unnamed protein product [Vitrella brassicaformis CCMP3155]|eukprot:CEM15922.1 unnamed protein product [Vitrella brassicaformis CCMP3155]
MNKLPEGVFNTLCSFLEPEEAAAVPRVSKAVHQTITVAVARYRIQQLITANHIGHMLGLREPRLRSARKKLTQMAYMLEHAGNIVSWGELFVYAKTCGVVEALPLRLGEEVEDVHKADFDRRPESMRQLSLFSHVLKPRSEMLLTHKKHPIATGALPYQANNPPVRVGVHYYLGIRDAIVDRVQQRGPFRPVVIVAHHSYDPDGAAGEERTDELAVQDPSTPFWGQQRLTSSRYTPDVTRRTITLAGTQAGDPFPCYIQLTSMLLYSTATLYTTEPPQPNANYNVYLNQGDPAAAYPWTVAMVRQALGQQDAQTLLRL